jgi:hypothetical protein
MQSRPMQETDITTNTAKTEINAHTKTDSAL